MGVRESRNNMPASNAPSDLDDIWDYIAEDSPQNADRFIDRIYDFCVSTLAYQPMMALK